MSDTHEATSLLTTHRGQLAAASIIVMVVGALLGRSPDILWDGAEAAQEQADANAIAVQVLDLRMRVVLLNLQTICDAQQLDCINVADLETH